MEWNLIAANRPADMIFGKTGAFKWRVIDDKSVEVWCRNGLDGSEHLVTLPEECLKGLQLWLSGKYLIQDALPNVSADDRETMLSGITDWDETVGSDL